MKDKKWIIAFAVIIIFQLVIFVKIISLEDEVKRFRRESNHIIDNSIGRKLSRVQESDNEILESIKKGASIVSDCYVKKGKIDKSNFTYPLTFCVVPKERNDNTKISIVVDGKNLELNKDGETYTASIKANVGKEYKVQNVSIQTDGVTKSEKLDGSLMYANSSIYEIFPELNASFTGITSYSIDDRSSDDKKIKYNGNRDLKIGIFYARNDEDNFDNAVKIKNMKYVIKKNDEVIEEKSIDLSDEPDEKIKVDDIGIYEKVKENYELLEDDVFTYILKGEFEGGYTFEYNFFKTTGKDLLEVTGRNVAEASADVYESDREARKEAIMAGYIIRDKDGKVISGEVKR